MQHLARGYIASGEFNGCRTPQHIQNQIIKNYCDANNLKFVLSRAEYWINGSCQCQLWACLKEGYKNIFFFSLWQLPQDKSERLKVFEYCSKANINLHFATERFSTNVDKNFIDDLEILMQTNSVVTHEESGEHLELLQLLL